MADTRSFVAGSYGLMLDEKPCGFLRRVEGGGVSADVINEKASQDHLVRKHIGQPKYEDFTIEVGLDMAKPFWDWITDSLSMKYVRKSGAIVAYSYDLVAQSQREFHDAIITEVTFPALDGGSKEPGYLKVKFSPYLTQLKKATGKATVTRSKHKMFMASNFKLQIQGLDCTKVMKIDSFTVKQHVEQLAVGERRNFEQAIGTMDFPNLKISMSSAHADPWQEWFHKFVIDGNSGEEAEKNGGLTPLSSNQHDELASIKMMHLGIFRLAEDAATSNESIHRITADLYCEEMRFDPPTGE